MANPMTKPGRELVIDLINHDNGLEFTPADLLLAAPAPTAEGASRNTSVVVTGTGTTRYVGPQTVTYNRIDLAEYLGRWISSIEIIDGGGFADVLDAINAAFDLSLTLVDIQPDTIPPGDVWPKTVTIAAQPGSYIFIGSFDLSLTPSSGEVPAQAILTVEGDPILTMEGEYILTV